MTGIILLIFFIYLLFALKYKFMPYGRIGKNLNNRQGINSLMVLLGSSMGVGNIVGVGVAIYLAGPGVIFWMLVSALISSTTNYLEVYFSKKQSNHNYNPISYIKNRKISILYTILMIITALFIGNMTQINSIKVALDGISPVVILTLIIILFIISTIKYQNINKALSFIMPVASIIYLLCGIYLLYLGKENILSTIKLIILGAFKPESTVGIPFFYVFNQGVLFAVFSNEAGNGSSAMAFKESDGNPHKLGIIASLGPIIDTAIVCVLTGLIILSNDKFNNLKYQNYNPNEMIYIVEIYKEAFGNAGHVIMVSLIILFAFATLISWFYYARIGIKYLKINYLVFYVVYLVVIVISVYFKLINLMNLTNYLNISLLIINLCYLFKRVFVVKLKPTGDDLDAKE